MADGNPNHAMLTWEVFVDIITNREDAEQQAEHDLAEKSRANPFCLFAGSRKITTKSPPKIVRLGGHLSFCAPLPP